MKNSYKNKKNLPFFVLLLLMLLVFIISASANIEQIEPMILRAGTLATSEGHYCIGLYKLAEKVHEFSDGKITIEVYPDGVLGGERDLLEAVGLGTLDIAVAASAVVSNFSPDFKLFDLPYLVTDRQQVYNFVDGPMGRVLLDTLKPSGIHGLGIWEDGFRQFQNIVKEVVHPEDLKGIKLRVIESTVAQDIWVALGAFPIPMAWPEVFPSLQQGVINAIEIPLTGMYDNKSYEVVDYLSLTGHIYGPAVCAINNDLWESFSDEVKEIFIEAEVYAREEERAWCIEKEATLIQFFKEEGIKVTEVDKNEWKEACTSVYEKYKNVAKPEYIEALTGNK